jgi:peptidyl-dipeptidase A
MSITHRTPLSSPFSLVVGSALALSSIVLCTSACGGHEEAAKPTPVEQPKEEVKAPPPPNADDAKQFTTRVNGELKTVWTKAARASWVANTYITDDTEKMAAEADEAVMAYLGKAIPEAATLKDVPELEPDVARQLKLLRLSSSLPAPNDPAKRQELAEIASKMTSMYGKGKWCPPGEAVGSPKCQDLNQLSATLAKSQNYDELQAAWEGWRTVSVPMRPLYQRYVELANEGAQNIGFSNLGELWQSRYDVTPVEFEAEVERLWQQVKPLYQDLHCVVRTALAKKHPGKFDPKGPIPAHLLGNMWAQEWGTVYPLVEPHKVKASLDVTAALNKKKYDHTKMVKLGESFFTSLGLDPLPETFWQRSMFLKPADRDVVCHASAWDLTFEKDLRIKMCIKVDEEDLITIHHELGHIYYYMYYFDKPVLFQDGAHDGFHEAIGDALALSVTPAYLKKVGILDSVVESPEGLLNQQMKVALDKISFLPFGRMIDQWRWDVFSGKVPPDQYNAHWWKLRRDYQGLMSPVERTENDFDPGAKYHIPGNVPYVRYFMSFVLQFQLHKAMCEAAGHTGPLHTCSIHGSTAAGEKLKKLLASGSSKPWNDVLEEMTGTRTMDAGAFLEYFAPLAEYLKKKNEGQACGW